MAQDELYALHYKTGDKTIEFTRFSKEEDLQAYVVEQGLSPRTGLSSAVFDQLRDLVTNGKNPLEFIDITDPEAIDLETVQSTLYDKRTENGVNSNTCIICGKTTSPDTAKNVHLSTNGTLVATSSEHYRFSQGFFPVGSDCAKKLPKQFVF